MDDALPKPERAWEPKMAANCGMVCTGERMERYSSVRDQGVSHVTIGARRRKLPPSCSSVGLEPEDLVDPPRRPFTSAAAAANIDRRPRWDPKQTYNQPVRAMRRLDSNYV